MVKPSKYRNKWTIVDGIKFQSQREAKRYQELKLLERIEEICGLELQPRYAITVKGIHICTYVADFRYWDVAMNSNGKGIVHIEDVKGVRTPVYKLKKKLVEALYDIVIEEM